MTMLNGVLPRAGCLREQPHLLLYRGAPSSQITCPLTCVNLIDVRKPSKGGTTVANLLSCAPKQTALSVKFSHLSALVLREKSFESLSYLMND